MSDNTIKFYLGNKSNFENDFNFKVSGYENDPSNTPLVSDGKNLTIRNYGFTEKQGLVIFLDALGMKGIWKRFPPIEVIQKWSKVNHAFLSIEEDPEIQHLDFNFRALSDTIIITISNINSINNNLHKVFDVLIKPFTNSIRNKILLRGVITCGIFYWSDKLIIGPAIDEAAEYHNKVNWIGISTSPSLKLNLNEMNRNKSLISYRIPWKRVQILKDIAQIQPYLASLYDSTKFVVDNKTFKSKEKDIVEINNKKTTIIDNQRVNNLPAIPFNKETNATTMSDKKYDDLNDTSFIDKMISETTEPEVIAQLKKVKQNCVFYY